MSFPGLLAALALTALVAAYVLAPLLRREPRTAAGNALSRQLDRVGVYYERVLSNIRDLDEDHATGKISSEEYHTEREAWMQRGVALLRLADELRQHNPLLGGRVTDTAIDEAIEQSIARFRPEA